MRKFNLNILAIILFTASTGQAQTLVNLTKTVNTIFERTIRYSWIANMTLDPATEQPVVIPAGQFKIVNFNYEVIRDPARLAELGAPSQISDEYFVEGEICLENNSNTPITRIKIVDQVQEHVAGTENEYRNLPNSRRVWRPKTDVGPGQTECFPYSIAYKQIDESDKEGLDDLDDTHAYRNWASVSAFLGGQVIFLEIFRPFGDPSGGPVVTTEIDENANYTIDNPVCPDVLGCPTETGIGNTDGYVSGEWGFLITNGGNLCGEEFDLTAGLRVFRVGGFVLANDTDVFTVYTGDCE